MTPLDILVDLFGEEPIDLHCAVIPNAPGLAQLVLDALAEAGFQVVPKPDYRPARQGWHSIACRDLPCLASPRATVVLSWG